MEVALDVLVWGVAISLSVGALVWIFGSPAPVSDDVPDPVYVPCLLCHAIVDETQALRLRSGKGYVCANHRKRA